MTEKKVTKKATASKKTTKKSVLHINAESVGFRAGDVYQTLAASQTALCVEDIAKKANMTLEETYLGIGWLFKEGKVKEQENLITLA